MSWVLKKILVSIVLIWVVTSIVFFAIQIVPGDPAEIVLSQSGISPDPDVVAALREQLGLDKPFLQQYAERFGGLLHGNLGASLLDGASVSEEIAQRLPRTLELILAAAVLSFIVGVPTGALAGVRPGGVYDRMALAVSALLLSTPVFVVGTLLIYVLAQQLKLVPAGGFVPITSNIGTHLVLLAMPAFCLSLGLAANLFRMARGTVIDIASQDYVRAARAKGLPRVDIFVHFVIRNALIPVITLFALQLGGLLGGTVLVEYIFNWPGLSTLLISAIGARDYPMVMGVVATIAVLFVTLNLCVDLLYGVLDPRIRAS